MVGIYKLLIEKKIFEYLKDEFFDFIFEQSNYYLNKLEATQNFKNILKQKIFRFLNQIEREKVPKNKTLEKLSILLSNNVFSFSRFRSYIDCNKKGTVFQFLKDNGRTAICRSRLLRPGIR